jgi:hypothetical protein
MLAPFHPILFTPLSNPIGGQVENSINEPVVHSLQAGAGRVTTPIPHLSYSFFLGTRAWRAACLSFPVDTDAGSHDVLVGPSVGVGPKSVDEVCGFASRSGALARGKASVKPKRL